MGGTLSLIALSSIIIIFSYINYAKHQADIYLCAYFSGFWALLNVMVRTDFMEQLNSGFIAMLFWFLYTYLFSLFINGYNKGLIKLTGLENQANKK